MNDHADQQAVAQGHKAGREFEATEAAFAKVRQATIDALLHTGPGQEAVRERLIVTCQILEAVQSALMDVVNNGLVAAEAIRQRDLLRR